MSSEQKDTTTLAAESNYSAEERTLMALIRTALSMISFGFALVTIAMQK